MKRRMLTEEARRRLVLFVDVIVENLPEFYNWTPTEPTPGTGFSVMPYTDGCKRTWSGREAEG